MNSDLQPPPDDAWLEHHLRERPSNDYIVDAGFTARVVGALPRRNHRREWLLAGATVAGCAIAGWLAAPAFAELIADAGDSLATAVVENAALPAYLVVGATVLLTAGSTWWALARAARSR